MLKATRALRMPERNVEARMCFDQQMRLTGPPYKMLVDMSPLWSVPGKREACQ